MWAQVVLWLAVSPLVGALALTSGRSPARWQIVTAVALLVLGTPIWAGALSGRLGADGESPAAAGDGRTLSEEAGPSVADPAAQPSPEPPVDVATELAADLRRLCRNALTATDSVAALATLREGATELAAGSGHGYAPIRAAAYDACGDDIVALGAPEPEPEPEPPPEPEPKPEPKPEPEPAADLWTVVRVIDGDTVEVRNSSRTETVRVIGIDTPERGECGFEEASQALATMVLDRQVTLVPGARDDRDRYDRILRYLDADRVDAGLRLIEQGLAVARYDSRDGYGRHPRQDSYVAADAERPHRCVNAAPPAQPEPKASPAPTSSGPGSGPGGAWKNCTEAREAGAAPVHRGDPGYGKHLDRDNDGIGCE